ncbi:MAG TPA: hypothetical protein VK698_28520 [Kofleriaceae bacterium]|nr:hypothetical protein [Kofleriaceae bacterium]
MDGRADRGVEKVRRDRPRAPCLVSSGAAMDRGFDGDRCGAGCDGRHPDRRHPDRRQLERIEIWRIHRPAAPEIDSGGVLGGGPEAPGASLLLGLHRVERIEVRGAHPPAACRARD